MGQAQINVRIRACSRTSIARTKQAALTHNVRGKELKKLQLGNHIQPRTGFGCLKSYQFQHHTTKVNVTDRVIE